MLLGRLSAANIPLKVRKYKAAQFGSKASDLTDYLSSDVFRDDYANGKGVCLTGATAIRSDLFALMAKPFALGGQSVYLATLHQLIIMLDDDEGRAKLNKVTNLFIDWFEKDFGREDDCPYTYYQRAHVEDFLSARLSDPKKVAFFSTTRPWQTLKWWSRDFVNQYQPRIVQVTLPA